MMPAEKVAIAEWAGFCPICKKETTFRAANPWFRDHLKCLSCEGGSIPRERAMMAAIEEVCPDWPQRRVHESSPGGTGVSLRLFRECPGFVATQYLPALAPGQYNQVGFRNEDLERQTFPDCSFDLVVTQDVFEHLFDPAAATAEIFRTLKPGGYHVFTTPIYRGLKQTECRATRRGDAVQHLAQPEYHDNPIYPGGSLVTFHYGADFAALLRSWAPFEVEIRNAENRRSGIVGEFLDVIICRRPS